MFKIKYKPLILSVVLTLTLIVIIFMHTAKFGKNPSGAYLQRIQLSPNYRDGQFQNLQSTPPMAEGTNTFDALREMLFKKVIDKTPDRAISSHKTDLNSLPIHENALVWLGHGSYFLQVDSIRILVDPVLVAASPVSFFGSAFKGSTVYSPNDIPAIDYLLITHDHWDHLDYDTVKHLKNNRLKVICPLGVGSHFLHWGWSTDQLIELDWYDKTELPNNLLIHALPSRHFSGRTFARNKTLWASFMIQCSIGNVFLSGDGGYGSHIKSIKSQFNQIDFAVLENGQYDRKWANIHFMPELLKKAIEELNPKKFITVHNSKYALAQHSWYEPLENVLSYAENDSNRLLLPQIGDVVLLDGENKLNAPWWREKTND
ncbi:MAG: MBL fold metallo-hydrolase [Mangrovibacterium sp.]